MAHICFDADRLSGLTGVDVISLAACKLTLRGLAVSSGTAVGVAPVRTWRLDVGRLDDAEGGSGEELGVT